MRKSKTSFFVTEALMGKLLDGAQADAVADSVSQGFTTDQCWALVDFYLGLK